MREDDHRQLKAVRPEPRWPFALPASVLMFLLVIPLVALVCRGVLSHPFHQLRGGTAMKALKLSLETSFVSLIVIFVTGTPLAYILSRWKSRMRLWIDLLVDLPLVLPPSVAGLALLLAFGRKGLLGGTLQWMGISLPFTPAAVVLAQVFVAAPFYVRAARLGFASVERSLREAAEVEGATHPELFFFIMLPLAARASLNGLILSWARALGEFGATIFFAGNLVGRTQTMPLAIYLGFEQNVDAAVALSLFLLLISAGFLIVARRLEARHTY